VHFPFLFLRERVDERTFLIDQRLEDLRHADQAADFTRQETILKLISTELTKNTTRVVELAVRSEVQNSVLPALENITKMEVRAALNGQIAKGLGDSMKQVCSVLSRFLVLKHVLTNRDTQRPYQTRLKDFSSDQTYQPT
jgi:hypothetical protein